MRAMRTASYTEHAGKVYFDLPGVEMTPVCSTGDMLAILYDGEAGVLLKHGARDDVHRAARDMRSTLSNTGFQGPVDSLVVLDFPATAANRDLLNQVIACAGYLGRMIEAGKLPARAPAEGVDPFAARLPANKLRADLPPPSKGPLANQPLAAAGLISYRYRGPFGFIMIGAKDDEDALREARRSTVATVVIEKLERWNGATYQNVASSPIYNSCPGNKEPDWGRFTKLYVVRFWDEYTEPDHPPLWSVQGVLAPQYTRPSSKHGECEDIAAWFDSRDAALSAAQIMSERSGLPVVDYSIGKLTEEASPSP